MNLMRPPKGVVSRELQLGSGNPRRLAPLIATSTGKRLVAIGQKDELWLTELLWLICDRRRLVP